MKCSLASLVAAAGSAWGLTQQCSASEAVNESGNWFCGNVEHILYEGLPRGSWSYDEVLEMSPEGKCIVREKQYNGPLGPLAQDLSIHMRGPLNLKQAAVYTFDSECKPKSRRSRLRRSVAKKEHKRAAWVTATIDGKVVSWVNNWFGQPAATSSEPAAPSPASPRKTVYVASTTVTLAEAATRSPSASRVQTSAGPSMAVSTAQSPATSSGPSPFSQDEAPETPGEQDDIPETPIDQDEAPETPNDQDDIPKTPVQPESLACDWERVAYYSAEQQHAENIIFMGNYGGQGSGVWDSVWGNSLSYLNADGNAGSASPQILKNVQLKSNQEFSIFSAQKCDESCGFSRVPEMAYKGFGGANKVFLFHFSMPFDHDRGSNGDKPAIWALNAQIPRTSQYKACSCWRSGCGEVDIYEVLAPGDNKCKSTFHLDSRSGGSSDWFQRPAHSFIKVAVVFDQASSSVSIHRLNDDVDFAQSLDQETVQSWLRGTTKHQTLRSLFQMSS
ncbi:hypothetical protein CDD81_4394 [Ophiocordyceps australis]|uniref:glucan endo-1,3-beta-D-glucosidase n=1 Tax=Ophiocordyceps australis TaxID=1399860 RepID=A0A2C5XC85_9HYPO|nr:hypothetical protein CDD81_4394 [Ophiocordyceps australis]